MTDVLTQLIDGELVAASDGGTFQNVNPATLEVIGNAPAATVEDMDRAIAAARRAFDETDWSTNHAFRKHCLIQLQAALASEREEFRAELIAEVGTPILLTYGPQLDAPMDHAFTWPAENIENFPWRRDLGEVTALGSKAKLVVEKEPIGVVAAITPWNYPFEVVASKIGQALAAGNTVVLKPAPDTPFNSLRLARLAAQTDIPAGVFNVVTPAKTEVAAMLLTDPRVDLVSFTGSTAVGRTIMESGAATFKRTFLELGGKSALIVLDDADFATAIPGCAAIAMHAGQGCAMLSRLLLPRSRYEEGVQIAAAAVGSMPVGNPADASNFCGPVINERQYNRVRDYIQIGIDEGARVLAGGLDKPETGLPGWFIKPTLLADVTNDMRVAQEEIFGPVLVAIPYDDDDDAVRIANDSPYGLAGGVNGSPERAEAVARRIRAGSISVNGGMYFHPSAPFGGFKFSGIGRQGGMEGFEQYVETRTIASPAS